MNVNQGLQKYRNSSKSAKSKNEPKSEKETKKAAAAKEKETKTAKNGKVKATTQVETAIVEVEEADLKAKEEVELQREIAEELARDAVHMSLSLVKEDFSPTNSTRDKLIMEYAPLIK